MDLIRELLLAAESDSSGYAPRNLSIEGYSDDEVGYHKLLLIEAGLATGSETSDFGSSSPSALITRLTWKGHEFIDAAREQSIWEQAKSQVLDKGGSASFQIWLAVLTSLVKQNLGLR